MVWLSQLMKDYRVAWIHNEREFRTDSFTVVQEDGKEVLYGRTKRNHRNPGKLRKAGILKPLRWNY